MDEQSLIVRIVSNYDRMSWNFGPTLLTWLASHAPRVYHAILHADVQSQRRFSNHGSALAQTYNHAIMPLCNARDKLTQVRWGLRDFKYRFGRLPEGMWLPETAVDLATLEVLAEQGLRFTVLAPHQARAVRRISGPSPFGDLPSADFGDGWHDVSGGRIDPSRAYELRLPSGRSLALFFYDGPIARAVAFERLLDRGEDFISRLLYALSPHQSDDEARLVHFATDGETYGHHHTYGEMALAYALEKLDRQHEGVTLTNYGEFLARHPPTYEVQLLENTAWSCAHGIERWRSDCGCNTGSPLGWQQRWRAPLRAALDFLRDAIAPLYEQTAAPFFDDPWAARDAYIDVILDRSERSRARFLQTQSKTAEPPSGANATLLWKLLEMQRYAQLMYTSCGWFFNDIAGTEATKNIQYAGRVLQLAAELWSLPLEAPFLELLDAARGNTAEFPSGRAVYEHVVQKARVDLAQVGAHHAIASLFTASGHSLSKSTRVYCYSVKTQEQHNYHAGALRLGVGCLHITSEVTGEQAEVSYGALHLGDHNVSAGVSVELDGRGSDFCRQLRESLLPPFQRGDLPELLRTLDRNFESRTYSLKHVFRDEQRSIVNAILDKTLRTVGAALQQLYESNAPLMRFLSDIEVPPPGPLRLAADFALQSSLRSALGSSPLDPRHIHHLLDEVLHTGARLDIEPLRFALGATLDHLVFRLEQNPDDCRVLEELLTAVELASQPPLQVNLWKTQNAYAELREAFYPAVRLRTRNVAQANDWVDLFVRLGERLQVRLHPANSG